ncbi:hypothetical protein ASZ78_003499 [Callipepla squamata]|uniref:Ig-like domain-containing protein n=1 Tax=Callipepla squamata TaxID=9009 RepID=A0A226MHY2_CALSU|nr:hypothetical protein ASZ78_003499 [Callipepla squamata]
MCWGRGPCPNSKCSNKLLHTTGRRVTFRTSQRYDLQGYISYGDVSLTIQEVTAEDAGTYCCRVEIPGWFNDIKQNIQLLVLRATNNVKKKTTKNGSKSTKHSRKTTFAPQTTSDLQRTVQTAIFLTTTVPPAAPATTKAPTVTTALFPPIFDETRSGTSLEKMVSTSALPDFSASFQTPDVRTEGDGIFNSTELILLPEVTTEFPSILLTADTTEEANISVLTDDVPAVGEHNNIGSNCPASANHTSDTEVNPWSLRYGEEEPIVAPPTMLGFTEFSHQYRESWDENFCRHTRKFIMKSAFGPSILIYAYHYSLRPAEDLEKVFSGSEGENNLFVL